MDSKLRALARILGRMLGKQVDFRLGFMLGFILNPHAQRAYAECEYAQAI